MSAEPSICKKSSRLRPALGVFPPTFHVATNTLQPQSHFPTVRQHKANQMRYKMKMFTKRKTMGINTGHLEIQWVVPWANRSWIGLALQSLD